MGDTMNLGKRLKNLRSRYMGGISRTKAAELMGIAVNSLGMYENNQRTPDVINMRKICKFYNVTEEFLSAEIPDSFSVIEEELAESISMLSNADKLKVLGYIDCLKKNFNKK